MSAKTKNAFITVDLGYGDAGKGTMVDYLTRDHHAHTVVRFNGGAQAAHNVVTPQGQHHTFSQFGSGTFVNGVRTYLSRYMLIEPYALFNEEAHLRELGISDAFARLWIDRRALVTTLYQQAANRLKERARGTNRHGSCGVGVGETVADHLKFRDAVIFAGELPDKQTITRKLRFMRDAKWAELSDIRQLLKDDPDAQNDLNLFIDNQLIDIAADNYQYLAELVSLTDESDCKSLFDQTGTLIFEGAQGVLLDENYGFAPYTTWSTTTPHNAETMLTDTHYSGDVTRIGVLRSYMTRHGAGPFVTESPQLSEKLPEYHNSTSAWQQAFRVGYFDLLATRYALEVAKTIDSLAITHLDYLPHFPEINVCESYTLQTDLPDPEHFFTINKQTLTGIKVHAPPDLQHQQTLAQFLLACQPDYTRLNLPTTAHQITVFIERLEASLNMPINYISTGKTALDKKIWQSTFTS